MGYIPNTNHSKGAIYGGIYASRLARHIEIPIRRDEDELLPTKRLDYRSMTEHDFISKGEPRFQYNLVFSQGTREDIILLALGLFDLSKGRYTIMTDDLYTYWSLMTGAVPAPAPTYQWSLRIMSIFLDQTITSSGCRPS
jgi:hypothetical protein